MRHSIDDAATASTQHVTESAPLGKTLQVTLAGRHSIQQRHSPSPTIWRLALILGDGMFLMLALALVLWRAEYIYAGPGAFWYEQGSWNLEVLWGAFTLLLWSISAQLMHAQESYVASSRLRTIMRAFLALLLMFALWAVLTYPFLAHQSIYIKLMLLFLGVATLFLCAWRLAFAEIMHLPYFRRYAVIVGTNIAGRLIHEELRRFKRSGTELLGYIHESSEECALPSSDLPVLGSQGTLRYLVHNHLIDKIIMAIDYNVNPALFQEAIEATQHGISIVPMATLYEEATGKVPVEHIGDQWYVALPAEIMISPLYLAWRKVVDYSFGLLGLLGLGILFVFLAPLIYLFSPGPIFYKQERVGYRGRTFEVHKFRSMYVNAEQASGAMWAQKGDPRVTPIGRILRKTHLDEVPQIINILRGEMSLIGPRPERETFIADLEKIIPFYRCRLAVKPGLTGWAQVKHHYTSSSDESLIKSQYDLYYIKHQSITLDIYILIMTVVEMFLLRGR